MEYNGKELKEFKSDKPVVFDPPRKMLVRNVFGTIVQTTVYAYVPQLNAPVITYDGCFNYCAEIPEEPKTRRATNLELMKWLAQGNGCCTNVKGPRVWVSHDYDADCADMPCHALFRIRKWDDTDWHEPTADYMGLKG